MEAIIYVVIGIVFGVLLTALYHLKTIRQKERATQQSDTEQALLQQKIDDLQQRFDEALSEKQQIAKQLQDNQKEQVGEQAKLAAEQAKLAELKQQFEQQKEALKNEFRVVSEEVVKQRQKELSDNNQQGIGSLLKPLQEQINAFQKRINEVHDQTTKGNTSLEAEIKKVMEVGLKMRDDASNLTSALKGDAQQRGAWGEVQLERTLEMSGLIERAHYEKQAAFKDAEGRQKRPDYLVKLPAGKNIVIDSKVSLIAYEKAISLENEDEKTQAMNAHVTAIKKHIDDLASKDYANLIGVRSPDFVLMFMPIEPAYIEALKHNAQLFGYGYDKNIVLVSHTTLIPILRTVANLWVLEKSNNEARAISEKAGDIYNAVCTVAERVASLGNSLGTASKHYNSVVTAIAGQQGLQGKVARFTELSNKANKTMPQLEPRYLEHDTSKLDIQPLAIESEQQPDDE